MKNGIFWKRTILAHFEDPNLKKELSNWASKYRYSLVWADPDSPDLIAIGCFALVIDRTLIKNDIYFQYLEFLKEAHDSNSIRDSEVSETKEESICILIDKIKDLELPLLDVILQVDIRQENSVQWIIQNLELASKLVSGTSGND